MKFNLFSLAAIMSLMMPMACSDFYSDGDPSSESDFLKMSDELLLKSTTDDVSAFNVSRLEADFLVNLYNPDKDIDSVVEIGPKKSPSVYLYYFEKSWMAISGDKRYPPVLAYNDESVDKSSESIDLINLMAQSIEGASLCDEVDKNLLMWNFILEPLSYQYKDTYNIETTSSSQEKKWVMYYLGTRTGTDTTEVIKHLMSSRWSGESPWNKSFPYKMKIAKKVVLTAELFYFLHMKSGYPSMLYDDVEWEHNNGGINKDDDKLYYVYTLNPQDPSTRWEHMPLSSSESVSSLYFEYVSDFMLDIAGVTLKTFSADENRLPIPAPYIRYGLEYSSGDYDPVIVHQNLRNGLPVYVNLRGWSLDDENNSIIDGYVCKEDWVAHDYYVNYTSNYNGAYKIFDTEDELRQYVGADYKIGSVWSQRTATTTEYALRHNGDGAVDNSKYYLHSFSGWTEVPMSGKVKGKMIYDIKRKDSK